MAEFGIGVVREFDVNQSYPVGAFGHTDRDPDVARLANGGFVVAWFTPGEAGQPAGIAFQRFEADGDYDGAPVRLDNEGTDPVVTALPDGGFVLAWDGSPGIEYARFDSTGTMGGSIGPVGSTGTRIDRFPDMTTLADGGWVIVWEGESTGGDSDVYAQVFSPLGVAEPEVLISSAVAGDHVDPAVAALADGSYVVTWDRDTGAAD